MRDVPSSWRRAARRLHLEPLPAFVPELNPAEGVWVHLKRVELRNRCCQDREEPRGELRCALRSLRRKRHILRGCFAECGYA